MDKLDTEIEFYFKDCDGAKGSLIFETVNRDDMIERFVDFMQLAGWGMPEDIADDIKSLISGKFAGLHESKVDSYSR